MLNDANGWALRPLLPAFVAAVVLGSGCDDSAVDALAVTAQSDQWRGDEDVPPEDGFVNPLDPFEGITESVDDDGYYNAQDWTASGHCGEDWNYESGGATDLGKPVYASARGVVVSAAHEGSGWGNIVMIKHYIPRASHPDYVYITSTYAHLQSYSVSVGEVVARGQQIGTIGDADGKYSPHLHFEMRWNEALGPTANAGYHCPNGASGTFDPTEFIDDHPPGWE